MNIKSIIFIGMIILSFSCERNSKESTNRNINEKFDNVNKSKPIEKRLNEKSIETIDKVDETEEIEIEPPLINEEYLPNGIIEGDSTIWIMANMEKDYTIYGYETPSTESRKLFLFSVFTHNVKGNPLNCQYGSFYGTSGMEQVGIRLKYISDTLGFRKLKIIRNDSIENYSYVEKNWLEFEKD